MPIKFTSTLDISNNRITNVGAPTAANDAVTKVYVDSVATGLVWKDAVRAAAVTDVDLTNPGTIDGVTPANGERFLLMGQTDPAENGIYTFTGGALSRAGDADSAGELRPGSITTVSEGAGQGNKTYVLISDGPITLGTTPLTWTLANNNTAPVYVAGNGIDIDPSTHEVMVRTVNNGGVLNGSGGIAVQVSGTGGLSVGSQGLSINAGDGLGMDGSGNLVVSPDGQTLETFPGGVRAKVDPVGGLESSTDGLAVFTDADGGLARDAQGVKVVPADDSVEVDASGVKVKVDPDGGLTVVAAGVGLTANDGIVIDASGVGAAVKADSGLAVDATGLSAVAGDGIVIDANGIGAAVKADSGLAVDATGLSAVAGDGIVVDANGIGIDTTLVCRKYATTVGNGTDAVVTVTHNLGSRRVGVEVFSNAAPYDTVFVGVSRPDGNTVELDFGGDAPATGAYDVVVWG